MYFIESKLWGLRTSDSPFSLLISALCSTWRRSTSLLVGHSERRASVNAGGRAGEKTGGGKDGRHRERMWRLRGRKGAGSLCTDFYPGESGVEREIEEVCCTPSEGHLVRWRSG